MYPARYNLATFICLAAFMTAAPAPAAAKTIADARDEVVRETMRYLNVPYLWGGMHPDTGIDCSAFVQLVYHKADLRVPRVARDQYAGTSYLPPEAVRPGDLLFFSMGKPGASKVDHVGIYVGKGFFVHASVTNGIHIDSVTNQYYFQRLVSARKYRGF